MLKLIFIIDGLISALHFFYGSYLQNSHENIITEYENVYYLDTLIKYFMYIILCLINTIIQTLSRNVYSFPIILITVPQIQNNITKRFPEEIQIIRNIQENFLKFIVSKSIVTSLQKALLKKNIATKIRFFTIKYIYNNFSLTFLLKCLKYYFLVVILYYLRSNKDTYFYYRSIKLAYYSNTGQFFGSLTRTQAIKTLKDSTDVDIYFVNALYIILQSESDILRDIRYYLIKFFSILSIISFINYIYLHGYHVIVFVLFVPVLLKYLTNFTRIGTNKNIEKCLVLFFGILLEVGEGPCTILVYLYTFFKFLSKEIIFFIRNYSKIVEDSKRMEDLEELKGYSNDFFEEFDIEYSITPVDETGNNSKNDKKKNV